MIVGNMIYHTVINSDQQKIGIMAGCIKSIKRKLNIARVIFGVATAFMMFATYYLMQTMEGPLLFFMEILSTYTILFLLGLIFIRPKMFFPIRYNIFIHETPGRYKERSVVIIPEYFPRGREIIMIPLESVSRMGIVETTKIVKCTGQKISGLEIFISDEKGREIARFGFMAPDSEVKKTAVELWETIEKIREVAGNQRQ